MEQTKRNGRVTPWGVTGSVVAVLTSNLIRDMLADQPRSVRMAAAVAWVIAFVCVWALLGRAMFAGRPAEDQAAK